MPRGTWHLLNHQITLRLPANAWPAGRIEDDLREKLDGLYVVSGHRALGWLFRLTTCGFSLNYLVQTFGLLRKS